MEYMNRIEVRMFGKFEMIFNEQVLNLGCSQTTKAMKLLQLLIFHGKEGIHRSQVIQHLFGVDAEGNIQTNLRVVVHNLRKILEKSGLPEGDYIVIESGVYRFVADFPINVDAHRFEELVKSAENASEEEKYELLKEAFTLYKGHLLHLLQTGAELFVNDECLLFHERVTTVIISSLLSFGYVPNLAPDCYKPFRIFQTFEFPGDYYIP